MLFLPIGAEDDGSRAKPIATLALIAVNVVWFIGIYLSPGGSGWKEDVQKATQDVESYWAEHPNLTPPESLARLLGPEEFDEVAQEMKAAAANKRGSMAWLDDLERQELDRRARRLEDALAARPAYRYGFIPAKPTLRGLIGSLFTHGGLIHLAGNMLFLWAMGPFVESALGAGLFVAFYLASGAAAIAAHMAASGAIDEPLVGASGAIAGVMGALLVRNASASIRFLFLPIIWAPRLRFIFGIPAFVVLPLWFIEQVASAKMEPDAPTAWWAHIGGFVFGMAAGALLGRWKTRGAAAAPPRRAPHPRAVALPPPAYLGAPRPASSQTPVESAPRDVRRPAAPSRGARTRLRVAVVSTGSPGSLVILRGAEPLLRRALAPAESGTLALDETVELAEGPADLRIEVKLLAGASRYAAVPAVLKAGELRVLRIEPRPAGVAAELR